MKPSETQVGGEHYKDMPIQPWHFCQRNRIPYGESNVIKYVCRHRSKGGVEDLRKAIHNIEMIIEDEYGEDDAEVAETGGFKEESTEKYSYPVKAWAVGGNVAG